MWLEHWEWKSNTNNCRILHAPLRFHGNSYATMWNNGITFMLCSKFFFWYAEYHKQMVCVLCQVSYSNFSIICQTFMVSTFYVQIWTMMAWKKPQKGTKRRERREFSQLRTNYFHYYYFKWKSDLLKKDHHRFFAMFAFLLAVIERTLR